MSELNVIAFFVEYEGDPSVGDFDLDWEIHGPFFFNNPEEMEAFKSALADAFELLCPHRPVVYTWDEYFPPDPNLLNQTPKE